MHDLYDDDQERYIAETQPQPLMVNTKTWFEGIKSFDEEVRKRAKILKELRGIPKKRHYIRGVEL